MNTTIYNVHARRDGMYISVLPSHRNREHVRLFALRALESGCESVTIEVTRGTRTRRLTVTL